MNKRFIGEVLNVKKDFGKSTFTFYFKLEMDNVTMVVDKVNSAGSLLT
jgi:hypothetical protein